ncbi:MAG: alkaline phosphatase D family protein [Carbonactinosporaceae bacterium]
MTEVTRRGFLAGTVVTASAALPGWVAPAAALAVPVRIADPFTLGVASGDPTPDGVVLWTRLAPNPLADDGRGGMPDAAVPVQWQVATDDAFGNVVRSGQVTATADHAHSVHVEVFGLRPARGYFYRFRVGGDISPVGRTRTAPPRDARLSSLAFAFASCQRFPTGFYTAYRDMADQDLDVVVHLGDYIYEGGDQGTLGRGHLPGREITTLADHRVRHAQYKTDPNLQAAHAAFPWIVTWDDHEVDNNYAGADADPDAPAAEFLARRAAAYQAYYEHLPLRRSSVPTGPDARLFRRLTFGDLAEFNVLDTRQFRDDQPNCAGQPVIDGYCAPALDPARTMLGPEQRRWLFDGLGSSRARWNVLAQQILFAQQDNDPSLDRAEYVGGGDQWDGYKAERDAVLAFLAESRVDNPIVLTGDWHRNAVYDLKADFADPDSATLGVEFVGTSISSGGDPVNPVTRFEDPNDPHERFLNTNRGYVLCDLTRQRWRSRFRVVSTVAAPQAVARTLETFVVEHGRPGARRS